mgnify:CR=1 FL=1
MKDYYQKSMRALQLAGMSENQIASAAEAAKARDMEGKYVLPLLNYTNQPYNASLENRALRERIQMTSLGRGSSGGEFDNREVMSEIARIRAERAQLMGYENHAAYILEALNKLYDAGKLAAELTSKTAEGAE